MLLILLLLWFNDNIECPAFTLVLRILFFSILDLFLFSDLRLVEDVFHMQYMMQALIPLVTRTGFRLYILSHYFGNCLHLVLWYRVNVRVKEVRVGSTLTHQRRTILTWGRHPALVHELLWAHHIGIRLTTVIHRRRHFHLGCFLPQREGEMAHVLGARADDRSDAATLSHSLLQRKVDRVFLQLKFCD